MQGGVKVCPGKEVGVEHEEVRGTAATHRNVPEHIEWVPRAPWREESGTPLQERDSEAVAHPTDIAGDEIVLGQEGTALIEGMFLE